MNWTVLEQASAQHGLFLMGALHEANETLALIGGAPEMWMQFQAAREYRDGLPDPLDRWSKRVLATLGTPYDASAVFPSDGPPYAPFIAWAKATGRFWQSPTGMLVHDQAGLMISIRGALRFDGALPLPVHRAICPCSACEVQLCANACPVGALSAQIAYDVPACKSHLSTAAGAECMNHGCAARRACPVSTGFGRDPAQSAFHMRAFTGG